MDIQKIADDCISLAKYACSKAHDGKHCWIYYHGEGQRTCTACSASQPLWADRTGGPTGLQAKAELGRYVKVTPVLANGTAPGQAQDRMAFLIKASDWIMLDLGNRVELMQALFGDAQGPVNGWQVE